MSGTEYTGSEIAVVGMAGRFPGARTLDQFWRNLRDGVESVRTLSDDELRAAGVPEEHLRDPNYVKAAAVLDDVAGWDAGFWGFAPLDAAIMDPQHRLFLECAWEALENAGHTPAGFPGAVGVFAGCGTGTYFNSHLLPNRKLMDSVGFFLLRHTGNDKDFIATRVSYELDLKGPSLSVQTACSTSLVAIHLASQSLLNGECDMALAGGVTIELPHGIGYHYKDGEILSPDGHCRAFDAESKGTIFGSGAGVVVLRRLSDAIADGDHIHCIIKGSAINNDGSSKVGYLAPSVDGQAAAVSEALSIAGVEPETIGVIEAHGTGTPVGDPIEVAALTQAFRGAGSDGTGYCAIGSLKSNIGHTDTAAGVASFIKAALEMQHRQLAPSLHFTSPNPLLEIETSPFFVNAQLRDWTPPAGVPRRAGVSSLGVGGTNAHIIVEEAPAPAPSGPSRAQQLFLLSARTRTALDTLGANLADHLLEHPERPLADAAWTLQVGRTPLRERRAVVAASAEELSALLEEADEKKVVTATARPGSRSIAMMFAGGGAQYANMGRGLYEGEKVYRDAVDRCLAILQPILSFDLRAILFPAPGEEAAAQQKLERPQAALASLFLTQYAMAKLLESWGVKPSAMIGHSMGEYTAACVAGVFSLEDALAVVALRGRLFETVPAGGMLSVPMREEALRELLPEGVSIAVVNGPELCVASGPNDMLDALQRTLEAREVDCRRIRIDIAAHSAMLEPILEEFGAFFRTIRMSAPVIPFASNLSGTWITAAEATDPQYWVRHLRHTVRFADGLKTLLGDTDRVLLEVGPGRTMASLARQHPDRQAEQLVVGSMRHPDDAGTDLAAALGALGRLWAAGVELDVDAFWSGQERRRVQLPTYPFERQRHWIDAPKPNELAAVAAESAPGERKPVQDWFYVPSWKKTPVPAHAAAGESRSVLVFADDTGLGDALASRLRADGRPVIEVRPGAAYVRTGDAAFTLRPESAGDMDALLGALAAEKKLPALVAHCWTVGGEDLSLAEQKARAFDSLFHLAQSLGREEPPHPVRITVISTGLQQVSLEPSLSPARALLLGPVHVIPTEMPGIACRSVDVVPEATGSWKAKRLVEALRAELEHASDEREVAYRGAERLTRSWEPSRLDDSAAGTRRVRDGGVYVITGGLGGIGLTIAEHLARTAKARLVLLSRSGLPPREQWDAIADAKVAAQVRSVRALEALGAEVMVEACDVTDRERLTLVLAEALARWGAVHGVIHSAGALDDGLLQLKDDAAVAAVLAPKVQGTLALDAAIADALDEPLDFMVLFSSISAMAGIAGQVDYASANAFLDAFARERTLRDASYTLSLGWSSWRDVGMAAAMAAELGVELPAPAPDHPLLSRRVYAHGAEELFATEASIATHWLLDEHRIREGHALIPGTGYLEIARAAVAVQGSPLPLEIRDVAFLSPFVVLDDETRELRVHVRRDGANGSFVIAGRTDGEEGPGWEEHATGTIGWVDAAAERRTIDLAAIRARCNRRSEGPRLVSEEPHLEFGPRWENLRRLEYGDGEALATLELPERFADDLRHFELHPALLDMATACAQSIIPGFEFERDFYVPLSYTRLRQYAPLERKVFSHVRLVPGELDPREIAVFDVVITDAEGRELVEVREFMMTRVVDKEALSGERHARHRRTAVMLDDVAAAPAQGGSAPWLERAITPAEGAEVFRRVLAANVAPQVLVSPEPLLAMVERMRTPATPAAAQDEPATVPGVALEEIEAVLATHEAVRQAVVLARRDRPGNVRLVAYVVNDPEHHVTVSELRRFLKSRLPENMVPTTYVTLDELPLEADGVVDRAALPDPFGAADDFVAPRTEMERTLAEIWCDVLGVKQVGVHDNFFDVGGHSLLAVRVVTRLDKKTGVRLNQAVMVLQTLEQIAAECERRLAAQAPAAASEAPPVAAPSQGLASKLFGAFKGKGAAK